ncbi:MAG: hypothetical protein HC859_16680 [Bacteroidia bacterium]|nr:hypothetical protein [Bacteroidia bacterium]
MRTLLLIVIVCMLQCQSTSQQRFTPYLTDNETAIVLAKNTAPVPIGLYAMIVPRTLEQDRVKHADLRDRSIYKIVRQPHIAAVALHVWSRHISTPDGWNFDVVEEAVKEIQEAARLAGRGRMPIFVKWYFESVPDWKLQKARKISLNKNATLLETAEGLRAIVPQRLTDDSEQQRDANPDKYNRAIPVNTSEAFIKFTKEGARAIGRWLAQFDPEGSLIPLTSTIAPSLRSNHMRIPNPNTFIPMLEQYGWTAQRHIEVFKELLDEMLQQPGFKGRCWVFNMDNQSGARYRGRVFPDTRDQAGVVDYVRSRLPPEGYCLLVKHESMTVNFQQKVLRKGPGDCTIPVVTQPTTSGGSYRFQFLNRHAQAPYHYIAEQSLAHGYENWGSMYYSDEMLKFGQNRQPGYFPFDSLIANVTKLDLSSSQPKQPQGTLWLEIWTQEARDPEGECHYFPFYSDTPASGYTLHHDLERLRDAILRGIRSLVKP